MNNYARFVRLGNVYGPTNECRLCHERDGSLRIHVTSNLSLTSPIIEMLCEEYSGVVDRETRHVKIHSESVYSSAGRLVLRATHSNRSKPYYIDPLVQPNGVDWRYRR